MVKGKSNSVFSSLLTHLKEAMKDSESKDQYTLMKEIEENTLLVNLTHNRGNIKHDSLKGLKIISGYNKIESLINRGISLQQTK